MHFNNTNSINNQPSAPPPPPLTLPNSVNTKKNTNTPTQLTINNNTIYPKRRYSGSSLNLGSIYYNHNNLHNQHPKTTIYPQLILNENNYCKQDQQNPPNYND